MGLTEQNKDTIMIIELEITQDKIDEARKNCENTDSISKNCLFADLINEALKDEYFCQVGNHYIYIGDGRMSDKDLFPSKPQKSNSLRICCTSEIRTMINDFDNCVTIEDQIVELEIPENCQKYFKTQFEV